MVRVPVNYQGKLLIENDRKMNGKLNSASKGRKFVHTVDCFREADSALIHDLRQILVDGRESSAYEFRSNVARPFSQR